MKYRRFSRAMFCVALAVCILSAAFLPALAAGMSYDVIVSPKYDDAKSFSEGLAAVKQNGKWGFIDETGKTIIPFEYGYAFQFSEGLAVVGTATQLEAYVPVGEPDEYGYYEEYEYKLTDGYLWYVIDKENNRKPLMYWEENDADRINKQAQVACAGFEEDLNPAVYYHNGYVNMSGYMTCDGWAPSQVFDRNGQQLELGDYSVEGCFNEGLFAAYEAATPNGCYLDEDGQVVLYFADGEDYYLRPFNQGLAPFSVYNWETDESLWGFINKDGKVVIAQQYVDFYVNGIYSTYQVFNDGIASVQNRNGDWGGINTAGQTVIPFQYDVLGVFNEGVAPACKDGKYGVINAKNEIVVPFVYDRLSGYSDGRCVAVKDGRAFCIDRYGNEITGSNLVSQEIYFPEGLDSLRLMTPDDIIAIQEGGKYGFAQIGYTPEPPKKGELADWAYDEVVKAIDHDLIPTELQNQYLVNITRADFAELIVNLLTVTSGTDIDEIILDETGKTLDSLVASYPFTDTTSRDIIAANALGLINGRGNGIFDPYNKITRQEAAALLMRIAKYLGKTDVDVEAINFSDAASVQSYAKEAVAYVKALGVMNGTSETTFSPYGNYTRQQAYMTIWRLYNAVTAG